MKRKSVINIIKKSRLIKSVIIATLVSSMVLSSLQSIDAEPSMIKNNSEFREDAKNPERGTIRTVPYQFQTIQAAIDASSNEDVVVVYPEGSPYQDDGNRDLDFSHNLPPGQTRAITVRSNAEDVATSQTGGNLQSPPDHPFWAVFWSIVDDTIIDCEGSQSDPHRGFIFQTGETKDSIVRGFNITNGCIITSLIDELNPEGGGAILCQSSNPTIEYNIIYNNKVVGVCNGLPVGGAILCIDSSSPIIRYNIIEGNQALNYYEWGAGRGGGIACIRSSPSIEHNWIIGNIAGPREQGRSGSTEETTGRDWVAWDKSRGGGIYLHDNAHPRITSNTISGNAARASIRRLGTSYFSQGGGIYSSPYERWDQSPYYYRCNPTMINNDFVGNTALAYSSITGASGGTAEGGGFFGSAARENGLTRNNFTGNRVEVKGVLKTGGDVAGGGIYIDSDDSIIADNIFQNNIATVEDVQPGLVDLSSTTASGGGMYVGGNGLDNENLAFVIRNRIEGNEVRGGGCHYTAAYGGGIEAGGCCVVDRNIIKNNIVSVNTPVFQEEVCGPFYYAPDMYNAYTIPGCGGGVAVTGKSFLTNDIIVGNRVRVTNQQSGTGYKALGGGVAIADTGTSCNADVVNCVIAGNSVSTNIEDMACGGGVGFASTSWRDVGIVNSILWDNRAQQGQQIAIFSPPHESLRIYIHVNHSDVQGGSSSSSVFGFGSYSLLLWEDSLDVDPKFVYPGKWYNDVYVAGNYHIKSGSPCIDAGSNQLPKNVCGSSTPCLLDLLRWLTKDIDDQNRFINDPGTLDTGWPGICNYLGIIDIGVDERVFSIGDVNGDGKVDFGDINPFVYAVTVMGQSDQFYMRYPDGNYWAADINQDGFVNFDDINPFIALLIGG